MSIVLNPYLNFAGTAREAMTYYQSVFGGELNLGTFAENGMSDDPADTERIMHGQLETPHGLTLMGADVPTAVQGTPSNGSISLSGDDSEALTRFFNALADGGSITEPLTRAPWGDSFGMLVDRYGVDWLVNISGGDAGDTSE